MHPQCQRIFVYGNEYETRPGIALHPTNYKAAWSASSARVNCTNEQLLSMRPLSNNVSVYVEIDTHRLQPRPGPSNAVRSLSLLIFSGTFANIQTLIYVISIFPIQKLVVWLSTDQTGPNLWQILTYATTYRLYQRACFEGHPKP